MKSVHSPVSLHFFFAFQVAHSPVKPAEELLREFDDLEVKRSDFDRYMHKKFEYAAKLGGDSAITTGMRRYISDIFGMDKNIGRLIDKLDDLGIRDNTILAFMPDHGAASIMVNKQSTPTSMMGWAGGLKGSKHTFYEGGLRVPFILSWPGHVPAGKVNDKSIVSALDWLPTICSLAGVFIDRKMYDGEDVADIWLGEQQRSRKHPLFWKFSREASERALVYGKWKMFADRQGDFSLYDLDRDSAESENITSKVPEIAKQMKQSLLQWEKSLPSQYCNMKQGCETPIPFDGSTQPIYVDPPQILVANDDLDSVRKPPFGDIDGVSKKDDDVPPSGADKSDGTKPSHLTPTAAPAPINTNKTGKEENVSYDGEDLDHIEETSKPTSMPHAVPVEDEVPHSGTSTTSNPTASPVFAITPTLPVDAFPPLTEVGGGVELPSELESKDHKQKPGDYDTDNGTKWQPDPAVTSSAEITQRKWGLSLITWVASFLLSIFLR